MCLAEKTRGAGIGATKLLLSLAQPHPDDEHDDHNQHSADDHPHQRTLKAMKSANATRHSASFFLLTTWRAYLNILSVEPARPLVSELRRPQTASAMKIFEEGLEWQRKRKLRRRKRKSN
jgi:hypothetical protein